MFEQDLDVKYKQNDDVFTLLYKSYDGNEDFPYDEEELAIYLVELLNDHNFICGLNNNEDTQTDFVDEPDDPEDDNEPLTDYDDEYEDQGNFSDAEYEDDVNALMCVEIAWMHGHGMHA